MDQLCQQCSLLGREIEAFLVNDAKYWNPFSLGSRRELSKKAISCKFCSVMTRALCSDDKIEADEDQAEIEFLIDDVDENVLEVAGRSWDSGIGSLYILPLQKSKKVLAGRLVNREYVDIPLIRSWIKCCYTWHQGFCDRNPNPDRQPNVPVRVIDVIRKSLVRLLYPAEYVVLSYVWGRGRNLMTTTSNLAAFEKEGALNGDTVYIPRTIQDAMTLTSLIGEQYLWVDALCIVQRGCVQP